MDRLDRKILRLCREDAALAVWPMSPRRLGFRPAVLAAHSSSRRRASSSGASPCSRPRERVNARVNGVRVDPHLLVQP